MGRVFLECPFPLSLLCFRLYVVSIGVSLAVSFGGVFCLLGFLVRVVSLGAGDAGTSALLGCLGVGALGSCSSFFGVIPFFLFSADLRLSTFRTRRVFRFLGWV